LSLHNDLTFFTNEPDRTLYDRFNKILKSNTQFFDALVGYFRTSGFYQIYPALKEVEKIRILVGLNVDNKTIQLIEESKNKNILSELSHKNIKENFSNSIIEEMDTSEDKINIEEGIQTFINLMKNNRLEMRIFPKAPIHAKVYILRKNMEKVPDQFGSIITGSSNFSKSGLKNNLEFNVELKDSRDVEFALNKFNELWEQSIDITTDYIETINKKTWIRPDIKPYELYLKTLYEYFKEEINDDKIQTWDEDLPNHFMKLQYQSDAVLQAKKILNTYNGVFISDVVGLGKTYICALLAQKLQGKKLIICPPILVDYWENTLKQFEVIAKVESLGKLDKIIENKNLMNKIQYVFIDESHRFRNSKTESYEKIHEICFNKKVILITATPQNNYSSDIASQIFLFQPKNNSTIIPNNKNLELFFKQLDKSLKKSEKGSDQYIQTLKNNSNIIRNQVLRHIMIRRTRNEISQYYKTDLTKQGLKFPEFNKPEKIVYSFNSEIDKVFKHTIATIKDLTYARYKPLTYLSNPQKNISIQLSSQRNISGFMKSILVKRLESSFEAFKKTLYRFIQSNIKFLEMCNSGTVYISKKVDIYDLLNNDDDDKILDLIENNEVQEFQINEFGDSFISDIEKDLNLFKILFSEWTNINEDPKKDQFLLELKNNKTLKNKKIIIFTESKETATYINTYLNQKYPNKTIEFNGQSSTSSREIIEANFNPSFTGQKLDNKQFLITTDVLSEGINLHRSNIVVNYDLPWNPTKIMQRVGRINRVGTEFDKINIFNFFPTDQSSIHLSLEENIILKLQAFRDTLGEDFKYLSESEEITSYQLYTQINGEFIDDDNEENDSYGLKYLEIIRQVRDNDYLLYKKIKNLPLKSKSGRETNLVDENNTLSFIIKDGIKKFFISDDKESRELFFLEAIKYLQATPTDKIRSTSNQYFEQLKQNKEGFIKSLQENSSLIINYKQKSRNEMKISAYLKAIKNSSYFTDEDIILINKYIKAWEDGRIPTHKTKQILNIINKNIIPNKQDDYINLLNIFETEVPNKYIEIEEINKDQNTLTNLKIILSSFLKRSENTI